MVEFDEDKNKDKDKIKIDITWKMISFWLFFMIKIQIIHTTIRHTLNTQIKIKGILLIAI